MKRFIYSTITAVVIFLIVFLSVTSLPAGPSFSHLDKLEHAFAYFVLALSMHLTLKQWGVGSKSFAVVLLFSIALGGGLEILQSQIGRMMDLADFAADFIGALSGLLIGRLFSSASLKTRWQRKR